jgi:hypothetical protein
VWLSPSLGSALQPATFLVGASAGIAIDVDAFAFASDFSARFASTEDGGAALSARLLSLSASAELVLTRGPRLALGPGLRVGHAHLGAEPEGVPLDAGSVGELWLGPFAGASLLLPLARATNVRLALEAGYVARPVVGLDQRGQDLLALRGPWLSAELGLALEL